MAHVEQRWPENPGVPGGVRQVEHLPFHEPVLAAVRVVAQGLALVAAALGVVGLIGWIVDSDLLRTVLPDAGASMMPNTALALPLLGFALVVAVRGPAARWPAPAARAAAGLVVLIGGLTLVEYVAGVSLGIDQVLFESTAGGATAAPGRMAPNTAAALLLLGLASLSALLPRLPAWTGQILGLGAVALGMVRIYGFAYHVPQLERFGAYTGMALHTALAVVLLGVAAFLARPGEGPAGLLWNAGTTGALGRRLMLTTLIAPLLLGWLVLAGESDGLYGPRMATALLVCGHVVVFSVVTFAALVTGRRIEVAHARAEWQVRQNELLQAFMDHTPAVVFIKDLSGRYLAVNTMFEESIGLSRGQVLGRRDRDVMAEELARHARAADLEMLESGRPVQRQERLTLPIGTRDYLTSLFPLKDPSGSPYAICGVTTDVTERVAAQREVERVNRRFLALLESAPDATVITDADGTIVMANAQVERLFGHAPAGLVGRSVVDLVPGRMRARHKALLLRYLATREPRPMVLDQGLYGLHGDGGVFPVEVSVSCSRGEYDTLVFLTARDISERRQIEEERAERYEQQRRVAYTLQHSLMGEPPPLPYLPSAHRYLASVQDPGVGGDWFDVIPLGGRRTGVVIGDVMGRGLEAAAVMGQLRAASHALARTGIEPCHLMSGLDAFVGDLADQLVTCLYLVIDQDAHEVTLCSAGHLPVVVLPAEGPAHRLAAPVGVPLGVNDLCGDSVPYRATTLPLRPGSTLALYTDGLVERPGTDIDAQIDILTDTLGALLADGQADAEMLDRAAAKLVETLIPDTAAHDDDVTLLLLGIPRTDRGPVRTAPRGGAP
ncbi:SpoIIE family protein phosphatase [Streptomyces sp. NPDC015414]|uniref:SpoIIE family protein phosphatase n=1 Tax=Streptomyces sp. NPDC015414 TaxID=3364957 RepID=UPI0036F554E0